MTSTPSPASSRIVIRPLPTAGASATRTRAPSGRPSKSVGTSRKQRQQPSLPNSPTIETQYGPFSTLHRRDAADGSADVTRAQSNLLGCHAWIWGFAGAPHSSPRRARAWDVPSPSSSPPRVPTWACALVPTPTLQTAAEAVRTHGVRVVATRADVADAEQARVAVERAVNEFGRLDALVVNAGGPPRGFFDDLDDETRGRQRTNSPS